MATPVASTAAAKPISTAVQNTADCIVPRPANTWPDHAGSCTEGGGATDARV